jgi:hypothetical protein
MQIDQQTPCHPKKPNKFAVFHRPNGSASPAIDAAAAEFSAPIAAISAAFAPTLCAC